MRSAHPPGPYDTGLLLGNPPYGERLEDAGSAQLLYKDMAELFEAFPGWDMGFITSRDDFETHLGRKANSTKKLKGGNLDTYFYQFIQGMQGAQKDKS